MDLRVESVVLTPEKRINSYLRFDVTLIAEREYSSTDLKEMTTTNIVAILQIENEILSTSIYSINNQITVHPNKSYQHYNLSFSFIANRNLLNTIEAYRSDDLEFQLKIHCTYYYKNQNDIIVSIPTRYAIAKKEISQKKWIKILEDLGYSESWILEVHRPNIAGMSEVIKHLNHAREKLSSKSPKDCVADLRSAWKSLEDLLNSNWNEVAKLIDRESNNQDNKSSKSQRIDDLKKSIYSLTNTGVHSEVYDTTMLDAEMYYQQTVSLIAYLSKHLKAAIDSRMES